MNQLLIKITLGISALAFGQTAAAQASKFPASEGFLLESADSAPSKTCLGHAADQKGALTLGVCTDLSTLSWKAGPAHGEYIRIVAENGLCLESSDGTKNAYLDTCREAKGQYWKITEVYGGAYFLTSLYRDSAGECLAITGQPNSAAKMEACKSSSPKIWRLEKPSVRSAVAAGNQVAATTTGKPSSGGAQTTQGGKGGKASTAPGQSKPAGKAISANQPSFLGQVLAAAVIQQLLAGAAGRQPANTLTLGDINKILALHNTARGRHHVGNVVWEPALAAIAQAEANSCGFRRTSVPGLGQNLAYWGLTNGLVPNESVAELVKGWYAESANYDYANLSTVNFYAGANDSVSNFTQMVWKDATQIGCGVSACGGTSIVGMNELLVCRYNVKANPDVGDTYLPVGLTLAAEPDVRFVYNDNVYSP